MPELRLVACPLCWLAEERGTPIPAASTEHILWRCPLIGKDQLELIRALYCIWQSQCKGRADEEMPPWFDFEPAFDYAHDGPSRTSVAHDFCRENDWALPRKHFEVPEQVQDQIRTDAELLPLVPNLCNSGSSYFAARGRECNLP